MQDSLLVDRDGNRYPVKVLLDNNLWMTINLKLNTPDSYCYDNKKIIVNDMDDYIHGKQLDRDVSY